MTPDHEDACPERNLLPDTTQNTDNGQPGAEEPAAQKTISAAKLAANRRNAQKSKGPTTAEGKSRSRWNAITHGMLAKRLLVFKAEDGDCFKLLLENLCHDLQPANTCEEILIEKIAMAYWRLHLAFGFESDLSLTANRFLGCCDRTGRYANTIHRQLMQDLTALERLQRRRNGEAVPVPISVDVNVSGLETAGLTDPPNDLNDTPGTMVEALSNEMNLESATSTEEAAEIEPGEGAN